MKNRKLQNIHPAVVAVWAAVVAAGHILPTVPIWGTGAVFSLSSALSPLSGIFFGPIAGALCSAVGGFIGCLIAPYTAWMGLFTFLIGTTTAFTAGCIAWGKWPPLAVNSSGSLIINGGIIVYLIGTILWFTQEIGRSAVRLPLFFYGIGFLAFLIGSIFSAKFFSGSRRILKLIAIWLCAFGGLIGGAAIGNFFSLVLYKMPREFWITITFVQPLERAVFALGATLIGVPLMEGLNKIGIPVGPDAGNSEQGIGNE